MLQLTVDVFEMELLRLVDALVVDNGLEERERDVTPADDEVDEGVASGVVAEVRVGAAADEQLEDEHVLGVHAERRRRRRLLATVVDLRRLAVRSKLPS